MKTDQLRSTINAFWDEHILPALTEYIKIPNKSPSFDPNWKANGHMDRVLDLARRWSKNHLPRGAELIIKETDGKTPLVLIDVPGDKNGNVLMYGHLDKQPEMDGWDEGTGPWSPILKGEKLFVQIKSPDLPYIKGIILTKKSLKDDDIHIGRETSKFKTAGNYMFALAKMTTIKEKEN